MIHAGAKVSIICTWFFFHATGGSVNMDMKERLKLIPYESASRVDYDQSFPRSIFGVF